MQTDIHSEYAALQKAAATDKKILLVVINLLVWSFDCIQYLIN